jgi:hypothetical protein
MTGSSEFSLTLRFQIQILIVALTSKFRGIAVTHEAFVSVTIRVAAGKYFGLIPLHDLM